jgi:hypothetical protein
LLDNTDKVQRSIANFEFGPAQIIIGVVVLFVVLALILQVFIFIRKHTGH